MAALLRSSRNQEAAPTFVVPPGSEITVDAMGRVNLRAPGNLVIQGVGVFGTLDAAGSIRIDAKAQVEALELRCGETCYVEGSLTAWRVRAKALHVEDSAHARIVLREVQHLQVSQRADLVGNFASEEELLLLFSRFSGQLRQLPSFVNRFGALTESGSPQPAPGLAMPASLRLAAGVSLPVAAALEHLAPIAAPTAPAAPPVTARLPDSAMDRLLDELPEHLLLALALLRKERPSVEGSARAALDRLLEHLTFGDTAALAREGSVLLDVLPQDRERIARARKLLARFVGIP